MKPAASLPGPIQVLGEDEIQERLYGAYRPRSRTPPPAATSNDSVWTGSQILEGEVQRLRSQLISLRQEKEGLEAQLQRIQPVASAEGILTRRLGALASAPGEGWIGRLLGAALLAGAIGYLLSGRMLQASPAGWETTPYTVQVAVYDGSVMAGRAEAFLKELGYDAFLVKSPRRDGRMRYRVYVGSFVTKEEARLENNRLAGDPRFRDFKDAFVRVR